MIFEPLALNDSTDFAWERALVDAERALWNCLCGEEPSAQLVLGGELRAVDRERLFDEIAEALGDQINVLILTAVLDTVEARMQARQTIAALISLWAREVADQAMLVRRAPDWWQDFESRVRRR